MNVRHPMGALHLFSIKNIFYDKMDLKPFYFHVTMLPKISRFYLLRFLIKFFFVS